MRSQFLTILCILTFISSGLGIIDAVTSLTRTDAVSERTRVRDTPRSEAEEKRAKEFYDDRSSDNNPTSDDPEQVRSLAIAQLAYNLLTLAGAVLMFRQRRVGFWVYVAGIVVGLILPVALAGRNGLGHTFAFLSVIFAVLYWFALKGEEGEKGGEEERKEGEKE